MHSVSSATAFAEYSRLEKALLARGAQRQRDALAVLWKRYEEAGGAPVGIDGPELRRSVTGASKGNPRNWATDLRQFLDEDYARSTCQASVRATVSFSPYRLGFASYGMGLLVGRKAQLRRLAQVVGSQLDERAKKRMPMSGAWTSVVGCQGLGKSHLAWAFTHSSAMDCEGVWLELGAVHEPSDFRSRLWALLSGSKSTLESALVARTADAPFLLVLDNGDDVLHRCRRQLRDFLRWCPRLVVLATCRERVDLAEEHCFALNALPAREAKRLLARWPSTYALQSQHQEAVLAACDGVPGRIICVARSSTPESLEALARAVAGSDVESYGLTADARRFLEHMAVFAGGWTATAGDDLLRRARVAQLSSESSAAQNNRLVQEEAGRFDLTETARVLLSSRLATSEHQLRSIHVEVMLDFAEHAARALEGAEQVVWLDRVRAEHANLRAAICFDLRQTGQGQSSHSALRILTSLRVFWELACCWEEAQDALHQALSLVGTPALVTSREHLGADGKALLVEAVKDLAPDVQAMLADALTMKGVLDFRQGRHIDATRWYGRALGIRQNLGDDVGVANSQYNLATVAHVRGRENVALVKECLQTYDTFDLDEGRARVALLRATMAHHAGDYLKAEKEATRSLRLFECSGKPMGRASARNLLGLSKLYLSGRAEDARQCFEKSLTDYHSLGYLPGEATAHQNLALAARRAKAYGEARRHLKQSLDALEDLDDQEGRANAIDGIGRIELAQRRPAAALSHSLAALRLRAGGSDEGAITDSLESVGLCLIDLKQHAVGTTLLAASHVCAESDERTAACTSAERALGDNYDHQWSEGLDMALDAAVSLALHVLR